LCDKLVFWSESLDLSVAPGSAVVNIELTSLAGFSGISGSNVGGGAEVYKQTTGGSTLEFRTLIGGTGGIGVVQNTDDVTISNTLIGSNKGGGAELYIGKTDNVLEFRTLYGGTGIVLDPLIDDSYTVLNTLDGENVGSFFGLGNVFKVKNGNLLQFRSLYSKDNSIIVEQETENVSLKINSSVNFNYRTDILVTYTYQAGLPGGTDYTKVDAIWSLNKFGPIVFLYIPRDIQSEGGGGYTRVNIVSGGTIPDTPINYRPNNIVHLPIPIVVDDANEHTTSHALVIDSGGIMTMQTEPNIPFGVATNDGGFGGNIVSWLGV